MATEAYPFFFTYHETVRGNGFLADVYTRGRARIVKEDDGWWMYGVEPGGLAEGGRTFGEAHLRFRQTFKEILFDIASSVSDFEAFKQEVERFVKEVNEPENQDWWKAVESVRSGSFVADQEVADYRREQAESETELVVEDITKRDVYSPAQNIDDDYYYTDHPVAA